MNTINSAASHGEDRKNIRRQGIKGRDSLDEDRRRVFSSKIVERIISSPEFINANTIMIYKGVRGEVRLDELEVVSGDLGKRLVYPLCTSRTEMVALYPHRTKDSWQKGSFGILEPVREKSTLVLPEEIDLVICPGTAFDMKCNRCGMGGGYYDRYLPLCTNAHIVLVAFEVQKFNDIPIDPWDKPMEKVFTERMVYTR